MMNETTMMDDDKVNAACLGRVVLEAMGRQPARDMHTHLFSPRFGTPVSHASGAADPAGLMLWGIDELVTYHYLVAEVFRVVPARAVPYEQFWRMSKAQQADHIWEHLFVERTPLSEACRGVLTTLQQLGLDPNEPSLNRYRAFFAEQKPDAYTDRVMELSNVSSITMTNEAFDENERARWLSDPQIGRDPRFKAALRIDRLLCDFPAAARQMGPWGYVLKSDIGGSTIDEAKRFLREWIDRLQPIYVAVSLPPTFRYPADPKDAAARAGEAMLSGVVLPVCAERGLPFAMMIGSERGVNPGLRGGGDMGRLADVASVTNLCREFPNNKFLVTMLSRENQHELCVAARKFGNLMIFGCWWFLNNPSLIEEIERMRFELLGTSFIPQHSDARILEQLIYKWDHSRRILSKVLEEKYADLLLTGRRLSVSQVQQDVRLLLEGNFTEFLRP